MATRIYFPSTGSIPSGLSNPNTGTWTETTGFVRRGAVQTRISSSMTSKTQSRTANAANNTWLDTQYAIGPLAAQTFGVSTVKGTIRALESAANDNVDAMRLLVRVVAPDGTTFRGTIYGPTNGTVAEFNTTLRAKRLATGGATTSVAITEGDYLVIEIGATATTGGVSISTDINYGDNSATDLGDNETDTAANNPFIEFAANMIFLRQSYGQANAKIKAISNGLGQAQADIKQTYTDKSGQAQATIIYVRQNFGQANALVGGTYTSYSDQFNRAGNLTLGIADNGDTYSIVTPSYPMSTDGSSLVYYWNGGNSSAYELNRTLVNSTGYFIQTRIKFQNIIDESYLHGLTIYLADTNGTVTSQSTLFSILTYGSLSRSNGFLWSGFSTSSGVIGVYADDTWFNVKSWIYPVSDNSFIVRVSIWTDAQSEESVYSNASQVTLTSPTFIFPKGGHPVIHVQAGGLGTSTSRVFVDYINISPLTSILFYNGGQAQAKIITPGIRNGQAQARIRDKRGYAQTQGKIKNTYFGLGQAHAWLRDNAGKYQLNGYGQAKANIKSPFSYGQTQAKLNAFGVGSYGQAQGYIQPRVFGQAQATIRIDVTAGFGQAQADIKATNNSFGQAQAFIQGYLTAFDEFNRVNASNLGTADGGGTYAYSGPAIWSIDGSVGQATFASSQYPHAHLFTVYTINQQSIIAIKFDKVPSPTDDTTWLLASVNGRVTPYSGAPFHNKYSAVVRFNHTVNSVQIAIYKIVLGVSTPIVAYTNVTRETFAANTWYWIRLDLSGTNPTTIGGKVWQDGTPEPSSYDVSTTDSESILQVASGAGFNIGSDGAANYPIVASVDHYSVNIPKVNGQAQADIKTTYFGLGQANADIKAVGFGLGQAQADIKAIGRGFGQAQADIKKTVRGIGLALGFITGDYTSVVDTFTRSVTDDWGTADTGGAWSVVTGPTKFDVDGAKGTADYSAFGSETIRLPRTLIGADVGIKFKLSLGTLTGTSVVFQFLFGTNASGIGNGYIVGISKTATETRVGVDYGTSVGSYSYNTGMPDNEEWEFHFTIVRAAGSKTKVRVKAFKVGTTEPDWTITTISGGYSSIPGILTLSRDFANSAVLATFDDINIISAGWTDSGQAQADIKAQGYGLGQAQADIKAVSFGLGQAQADIKTTYFALAQAQADIKATSFGLGQSQAFIIFKQNGLGQTLALITTSPVYTSVVDTATRSVTDGLGTADIGGDYTLISGTAANGDVNGSEITLQSSSSLLLYNLKNTLINQVEAVSIRFDFKLSVIPDTTWSEFIWFDAGLGTRDTSSRGWHVSVSFASGTGLVTAQVGNNAGIGSPSQTITPVVDTWYTVESTSARTSDGRIHRIKIYERGTIPTSYATAIFSYTPQPPGHVALRLSAKSSGNTPLVSIDNIEIVTTAWTVSGQAQADIKNTYFGLSQAQADIKAVGNGFGQAQADIKATSYALAQAQADIKATSFALGQAQATITGASSVFGQAQADIKQTYFALGQTQADIKAVSNGCGQVNADIKNTYYGLGQSQADIKQVGYGLGQSQADIKNTYYGLGQAQADIKNTYFGLGQSQADIKNTYYGLGQSAAWIKQTYYGLGQAQACIRGNAFGQAQADIKQTYYGLGQSQADIKNTYYGSGQANCSIVQTGYGSGQSQADIKQTYSQSAQAQADIKNTYVGCGQAAAWIKNTYYGSGQSNADIKQQGYGLGQSQADIKAVGYGSGQANADIKQTGYGLGQSQGDIKQTYTQSGQSQADIRNTYYGSGQAACWIKQTYSQCAQAQADIKQTYTQSGQSQADILTTYTNSGQSQADIRTTYNVCGQAQGAIKNTYYASGQAQAKLNAYGVNASGQAQGNIRFDGNAVSGQSQAKINAFDYNQWGQAQGSIKTTDNSSGQAQADIKSTYTVSANAQGTILQTYTQSGQANSDIKAVGYATGQAQATIQGNVFGQSQADIKATYYGTGQSQAKINAFDVNGYGQCQAYILSGKTAFGQAQGDIKAQGYGSGQSQSDIKATETSSGQTQADIKNTYFGLGQCQAWIKQTYFGEGQAQGYIRTTDNSSGQAQGDIKQTYTNSGQAQGDIRNTYYGSGQANCLIGTRNYGNGQANADIKATVSQSGQSQADVLNTYRGYAQSQADIKVTYIQSGQTNAYIILLQRGYGQAQGQIRNTYNQSGQAAGAIKNTYSTSGNAQGTIKVRVNVCAQAQATIANTYQQSGQAQALVTSGTAGYGQAAALIQNTYQAYGQAQAVIIKAAGYGQARAYIIFVFFFGTLEISDSNPVSLVLEDSDLDEEEITDTAKPQLTLEDSTIGLTLEDSGINLTLSDVNY